MSTSNITEELLAELGVMTMVLEEMVWMRATSAKLLVSTRLLPERVMVLVEVPVTATVVSEMESIVGESVALMYENWHVPVQKFRMRSLVETTTLRGSPVVYLLSIAGVLHWIYVAVMLSMVQNQFRAQPT